MVRINKNTTQKTEIRQDKNKNRMYFMFEII